MKIIPLFPVAIGRFDLGRSLSEEETSFITSLDTRPNMSNSMSVNNYVLKEAPMKELREFFVEKINEYFNLVYAPKANIKPYITQSWVNRTSKGDSHHKHAHPNSFLSGVFYVKANFEKDKITFYDDRVSQIIFTSAIQNSFNSTSWWVPVGTGTLLLFPSHVVHSVEVVEHEEERISLSFNTFLKGTLGSSEGLTELVLS